MILDPNTVIKFKDGSKATVVDHYITPTGKTNYELLDQCGVTFYLTQEEIHANQQP